MGIVRTLVNNLAGGIISPRMQARLDIKIAERAVSQCENFIIHPQGGASFRPPTRFVKYAEGNKKPTLFSFQFNDDQAYVLCMTEKNLTVYKDNGAVLETAKTITGVTVGSTTTITSTAHGFENGDEVFIDAVGGVSKVNGRFFVVANKATNTFEIKDVFGTAIVTTGYTYSSGGTASRVYELATPYHTVHHPYLQMPQSADTGYIAHRNYEPRKLTRTGHAAWTLATYARTPSTLFTPTAKTISGATKATQAVITATAHGFENNELVYIQSVVGMVELNTNFYFVSDKDANTFKIKDSSGNYIDSTGFTTYISGGTATTTNQYPAAASFIDSGRLGYAGTRANPSTIWLSKSPTDATLNFDIFTTGTAATDGLIFTLTTFQDGVPVIQWVSNTNKSLIIGTKGDIRRMYGATEAEAISPQGVNVKAINSYGVALASPLSDGASFFYIQDDLRKLRTLEYDISNDGFITTDRNLVSEHLTINGYTSITPQKGNPDLIWATMADGRLNCLTYLQKEDISGWHAHYIGGSAVSVDNVPLTRGKVVSVAKMSRPDSTDQLWLAVERRINGRTVYTIEYMTDPVEYPVPEQFYTGEDNKATDSENYSNVMYELHKKDARLDMNAYYDGSESATVTVTPGAITGTGVTFTAGAAIFSADMVGREIWKKYNGAGQGGGRAVITGYTSSTVVTCDIDSDFDTIDTIPAAMWYLTTDTLEALEYLEGETVSVVADGSYEGEFVVSSDGTINVGLQFGYAIVGYKYRGWIRTLNFEGGGRLGPTQMVKRLLLSATIRFLNTLGAKVGTSDYRLERVLFRSTDDKFGRSVPLANGVFSVKGTDKWERDQKRLTIIQDIPQPCTVTAIVAEVLITDEE